jgi:membrane protein DedA with SNARE-associated domain/rhodanese-related sulfurtransferase
MIDFSSFPIRQEYSLLFVWVLAEAAGLPLPSVPLLIAAGALAGRGHLNVFLCIALPWSAVVIINSIWYTVGRRSGSRVLRLVCRLSLEPDSCMRRAQVSLAKYGSSTLVFAKFIPGVNMMTAPLAGAGGMGRLQFEGLDALGALVWSSTYVGIGFAFSGELERIFSSLEFLGKGLTGLVIAVLGVYLLRKWQNRRQFLEKLRIARITPEELKARLDAGEDVMIVDLRHSSEFDAQSLTIPGAVHMNPNELERAQQLIPRDREVILFCSCPNEATAAQMALRLRARGVVRIRPLAEGFEGWRERHYPVSAAVTKQPDVP